MHRFIRLRAFLKSPCPDLFLVPLPTPLFPLTAEQWQAEFGVVVDADDRETRNHNPWADGDREFNPSSRE